jgi:hypothetical protein
MKSRTRFQLIIIGEICLFFLVLMVIWLDEFMDLPYHLLGAPPTPYRLQEYLLETASIFVVAIAVIAITIVILRRITRLERFLRVCAWCGKIWVDDEWISFEEYMLRRHSMKSSHGICEACVERLEKKSEQKRAHKRKDV